MPHTAEFIALARWGAVGIFGIYWLLGPAKLRDDIFFMLPESKPDLDEEAVYEIGHEPYGYVGAGTEDRS